MVQNQDFKNGGDPEVPHDVVLDCTNLQGVGLTPEYSFMCMMTS